jgi:phosphatidylserine/phosphatidylglycerophosphate/cardiolipin synthase-like enzyme
MWIDHMIDAADELEYRVTPMVANGDTFAPAAEGATDWTAPTVPVGEDASELSAYFNRGTLMSQIVSRFVQGDVSNSSLAKFKTSLKDATFPPRKYLSGHAREALLGFLGDADRRGSQVFAAVYECEDDEIIEAIKALGNRGHYLMGNGGNVAGLADQLTGAGLEVHQRDLSHAGRSSPSVHNKFAVEVNASGDATRALTGSLNWTTTGLCTQLNNTLVIDRPVIAARYLDQWRKLVASGDDMPDDLKASNAQWLADGPVSLAFAATGDQQEFAPVVDAINAAQKAILFLMFEPGESPLLTSILKRSGQADGPFIRGVVSTVVKSKAGDIVSQGGHVIMDGVDKATDDDVVLPEGVGEANRPTWAFDEFNRAAFLANSLHAIVHSKTIVIDPFSDDCVVVTGSHNFSPSASAKNDENIVVVRGDKDLARQYAVHIQGVYDAYSWRAFLDNRGDPNQIYQGLAQWKPGGPRTRELDFWVDG